jgi:hypothetical protein|tara:strand:- start:2629 stop:3009 length:381 start_codon:yes stop_codon:yes gene_type:complete
MLGIKSSRQLRAFRAAAFGFILTLALSLPSSTYAQAVYVTNYKSEADVIVYVTKYRGDADLVVYVAEYNYVANSSKARWFYVDSKFKSDKIIFFTEYRAQSDVKVYYTHYKNQSKWRNSEKFHLFQ